MVKNLKPKKVRSDGVPDERIAQALRNYKGLQYLAAKSLGIGGSCISQRISESPYLKQIRDDLLNERLDNAESNLSLLIEEDKDLGAICFFLKTRGKDRGYSESTRSDIVVSAEISEKADAVLMQITEAQKANLLI